MTIVKRYTVHSALVNGLYLALAFFSLSLFDRAIATGSVANLATLTMVLILLLCLLYIAEQERKEFLLKKSSQLQSLIKRRYLKIGGFVTTRDKDNFRAISEFVKKECSSEAGLLVFFELPWLIVYCVVLVVLSPYLVLFVLVFNLLLLAVKYFSTVSAKGIKPRVSNPFAEVSALSMGPVDPEKIDSHRVQWAGAIATLSTGVPSFVTTFAALLVISNQISVGALIISGILSQRLGGVLAKIPEMLRSKKRYLAYSGFLEGVLRNRSQRPSASRGRPEVLKFEFRSLIGPSGAPSDLIVQVRDLEFGCPSVSVITADNQSGLKKIYEMLSGDLPSSQSEVLFLGRDVNTISHGELSKKIFQLGPDLDFGPFEISFEEYVGTKLGGKVLASISHDLGLTDVTSRYPGIWSMTLREAVGILSPYDVRAFKVMGALLGEHNVFMMYEPLVGLTSQQRIFFSKLLSLNLSRRKSAVVIFSTRPEEFRGVDVYKFDGKRLARMQAPNLAGPK
jgi:ATP-binding cassette subfamily C protein EexD